MIIPFLFLFSCGPQLADSDANIPTPPPKIESSQPEIKDTDKNISDAKDVNTKISEKIQRSKEEFQKQKLNLEEAIAKAEKLKEKALSKKLITEIEMMDLISQLEKSKDRNLFLEEQNEDSEKFIETQRKSLQEADENIQKVSDKNIKLENNNETLRSQNKDLGERIINQDEKIRKANKDILKLEKEAASAKVYRNWIWGIAGAFVVYTIVKNILMYYFPNMRFRI